MIPRGGRGEGGISKDCGNYQCVFYYCTGGLGLATEKSTHAIKQVTRHSTSLPRVSLHCTVQDRGRVKIDYTNQTRRLKDCSRSSCGFASICMPKSQRGACCGVQSQPQLHSSGLFFYSYSTFTSHYSTQASPHNSLQVGSNLNGPDPWSLYAACDIELYHSSWGPIIL